jgi:shikimate dehydrogenase
MPPPAGDRVSAATRVVALLGHPVAHSVSPQLHNAAFAAAGVDAVYVALDVAVDAVERAVAGLAALDFLGANVTVPHKQQVYALVQRRTPTAEACGAGNTLFFDDEGALTLDNTDVEGLRQVLADDIGLAAGEQAVVFGAGGAARAAAVALGQLGAAVDFVGRRDAAVAAVRELALEAGAAVGAEGSPRVVVNATPLGLHGESLPDQFLHLTPEQTALDLVYGAVDTPFLAAARAAGAAAFDGRGMLVRQAALAFQRWTGVPAPLDVMVAAAEKALQSGTQPGGTTSR